MSEDRLARALAAESAPARDPDYTMAVLRRAEAERWRRTSRLAMVRGGLLGAAGAGAVIGFSAWASAWPDAALTGLIGAAGLFFVVGLARRLRSRLQAA